MRKFQLKSENNSNTQTSNWLQENGKRIEGPLQFADAEIANSKSVVFAKDDKLHTIDTPEDLETAKQQVDGDITALMYEVDTSALEQNAKSVS